MRDTSRYADGRFSQSLNKRGDDYDIFVLRKFNVGKLKRYSEYQFKEGDRIDVLADIFLGSSHLWSYIMDINPNVPDPFNIPVGTFIRIPRA